MRLDAVKLALPSRRVTNDDVVELIRRHSTETYNGNLDRLLAAIGTLLRRSGAEQRFWLSPEDDVMTLLAAAVGEAIAAARIGKADLDVLICAGVDRGFVEPATAYLVAQACDLGNIACFDVVDACNGWTRALQLVDALFRGGVYRRALIVNAEFPMLDGGAIYPGLFSLRHRKELAWSFAGFTLGEGVTATVVSADPDRDWEFHFSSRPDLADQSTVPLLGYQRYCRPSERIGINGVGQFAAFSGTMFAEAVDEIQKVFRRLTIPLGDIRAIIPHGATKRTWELGAEPLGVRDRLYHVYPRYGNLISASIPAGLATAVDEGALRRGDRAVVCGASAGMSFSACSFVY